MKNTLKENVVKCLKENEFYDSKGTGDRLSELSMVMQSISDDLDRKPVMIYKGFTIYENSEGRYFYKDEDENEDEQQIYMIYVLVLTDDISEDELLNPGFEYDISGEFDNLIGGESTYAYFNYEKKIYCMDCKKDVMRSQMSHSTVIDAGSEDEYIYSPASLYNSICKMKSAQKKVSGVKFTVSGGYCPHCLNSIE